MRTRSQQTKTGFTILELIVVIIIVGILAGLSLTRFVRLIEYSRITEATTNLKAVRQGMERCYILNNGNFTNCTGFDKIAIDDASSSPNAHFSYTFTVSAPQAYLIKASRNTREGGSGSSSDFVGLYVDYGATTTQAVYLQGSGIYNGYRQ